ncbi:hypothetical protein [Pseudomonas putida]|uniref:hypothetical protein n=1 Tax=Pseudomonas putida TaxID=303 RepID=UPI0015754A82|nr:hypothetical protein [Pseudomonas putida]NTY91377.1 hypothetical protein [Pseudomonas putida]NTZ02925.1 hypothetical protein [Pseudomonas putida]NTZ24293.1 hypothetical protein [Pseudomonas putida]NTZ57175.1 hypothetical protein [Pseudomonas putida]NTZ67696.1 hypothetical protein [Pseudomonas putida]
MVRPTLEQYYNYMKQKPRTREWGALLVYDRQKANILLMQEHILRAGTKAWIEPVSGDKVEGGTVFKLDNFTFGTPVLSFENSNIGASKAALSLPVLSGKITEWRREPGAHLPTLVGISHLNPLTAPGVKMNIKLNDGAGGVVDKDGRVYLDLADSDAYSFEVSQWEELNTKLGEFIEAKLKEIGRGEQIWELNTLKPVQGLLNPTSFGVRTHSLGKAGKPEASTNQADLEEGAIIVGVAFNGAANGGFPIEDGDMPYLLPERQSGVPYSMNIILSDEVWVKNVLNSLLDGLSGTKYVPREITYQKNASGFFTAAEAGAIAIDVEYAVVNRPKVGVQFTIRGDLGKLVFSFSPGTIDCTWSFVGDIPNGYLMAIYADGYWHRSGGPLALDLTASCSFSISMKDGVLILTKGPVTVDGTWGWYDDGEYDEEVLESWGIFKSYVEGLITEVFERFEGKLEVVDLMRLNGLLFRNGQRSVMDTLSVPGDISMLGELAPILTAFAIDPIEKTLVPEATQKLTLTPEPDAEVKWEVKALPDDPENPEGPEQLGEIVNDIYTAPKADTIAGTFRQVIITATVGDISSSALFTVVPKSVEVRPMLLNALFSLPDQPRRYVLEGGSIEAVLAWTKGAGFKGDLRDPTDAEYDELKIPRGKRVKIYVAPEKDPETDPGLGELMQLDQVLVTGGHHTEVIDITVLWKPASSSTVKVEAQGEALKLVLTDQKWGEPVRDLTPAETTWYVGKGTGIVDKETGIYKSGAEEGDYVIIAGVSNITENWNYAVVPMPYTPEEAQAFHEVNQAMNGKNASTPYTAE